VLRDEDAEQGQRKRAEFDPFVAAVTPSDYDPTFDDEAMEDVGHLEMTDGGATAMAMLEAEVDELCLKLVGIEIALAGGLWAPAPPAAGAPPSGQAVSAGCPGSRRWSTASPRPASNAAV
jgi:hypothetical protein